MIACKYCTMEKGITIRDCFETDEELAEHIEMEHDIAVRRPEETGKEAREGAKAKNPRIGTDNCRCPACKEKRRLEKFLFSRAIRN